MRFKRFGSEPTALYLTDKAQRVYSTTDPLDIYEYTVSGQTLYEMRGCLQHDGLTAQDVNEVLEQIYDDLQDVF